MLIVPIEEAEPGMKLAAPVVHPDHPDQSLLRHGYVLEDGVIARMKALRIPFVYVDYPPLDHLDRHLEVYLSPARQLVYQRIKQAVAGVQEHSRPEISYADYSSTTRELISTLMAQGRNPIFMDQMAGLGADAVSHGATVAHLSLLLGLKLEQYLIDQRRRLPAHRAKDIVNLGVAGMLHDLGKSKLPEPLRQYSDCDPPEHPQMLEEWQGHVRIGYELIRSEVEVTAAAAVFQHHQHFDGSGFPAPDRGGSVQSRMDGERIHIFSRILLCADLYDHLSKPGKGRRSNWQVLRLMRGRYAAWLDPEVLGALEATVPAFPPGCRLRLTDGTCAVVVDVNHGEPLRPTVRRLAADKWTPSEEVLDLRVAGAPGIDLPADEAAELAGVA